jgi:hypothetical protein
MEQLPWMNLWRAAYAPGDGHTGPVYSSQPVQCCTSCCTCFHSGDPDQVVPFVLYIVLLYNHSHTHTSAAISASRSLFHLRK